MSKKIPGWRNQTIKIVKEESNITKRRKDSIFETPQYYWQQPFWPKMARVRVTNVVVLNNPCKFYDPFQFQITFECLEIHDGKSRFILDLPGFTNCLDFCFNFCVIKSWSPYWARQYWYIALQCLARVPNSWSHIQGRGGGGVRKCNSALYFVLIVI